MIADPGKNGSRKARQETKALPYNSPAYNPASRIGGWNASPVSQGK
jgi:hypothetical protein